MFDGELKGSELAAAGKKTVTCIGPLTGKRPPKGTGQGTGKATGSGPTPLAPFPNPEQQCANDQQINTWYYSREWFCQIIFGLEVDTIETGTGNVVGTAVYTINHASGFDPRSGTWSNFTSFFIQSESGNAANIVDSTSHCSGCSGSSLGYPLSGPTTVPLQQAVTGRNDLSDNPASGAVDGNISVGWIDTFRCSTCGGSATAFYDFPLPVRCDWQAFPSSQGCAIPAFTPQLMLPDYLNGNTSTAYMAFISYWNVDHWGYPGSGTPMTRLQDQTQARANRRAMCESGYFVPDPTVPDDSCDEFPFASSYQSGNMLGLAPSDCSEILPQYVGAPNYWAFYSYGTYSTSQRCGLGHVRETDNESTGGTYGSFLQNNRVLDGDPFWIGW